MKIGFSPSKNAAHRLACLSLFRALLKQCAKFGPLDAQCSKLGSHGPNTTLGALVRYRFQHDKKFKNWQQIRDALHFGRSILDVVEKAASGSPKHLDTMALIVSASAKLFEQQKALLKKMKEEHAQQLLPKKIMKRKAREATLADRSSYRRQSETVPVLERPVSYEHALKHRDGRRKVPNYFVTQGIPFLRYTHRQPLSLSRYIQGQIDEHERRSANTAQTRQQFQMAHLEDEWDTRLQRDHMPNASGIRDDEEKWSDTHRAAWKESEASFARLDAKKLNYGKQLWSVVLKEEKLANSENHARKVDGRKRLYTPKDGHAEGRRNSEPV